MLDLIVSIVPVVCGGKFDITVITSYVSKLDRTVFIAYGGRFDYSVVIAPVCKVDITVSIASGDRLDIMVVIVCLRVGYSIACGGKI
jgi:hypothetical protein